MKYCPYCGAGLDDDMLFCPKCGKRYASDRINPNLTEMSASVMQPSEPSSPVVVRENPQSELRPSLSLPKKKKTGRWIGATIAVLAVVLGVLYYTGVLSRGFSENSSAIENASKSVVMLSCFDEDGDLKSTGSGFAVLDDLVIVTNYHVIDHGVYSAKATTQEGSSFSLNVLAYDEDKDIAILRADRETGLTPLSLGKSDTLQKGDKVVAIGSPLGLINTVSTGVFSGYVDDDGNQVLQFTAPISQGSSGGALFSDKGEVIGVTFASYTDGQNLNLGVPSDDVLELWDTWQKSEAEDPEAMYEIGDMFYYGLGISRDYYKAFALFNKASSLGSSNATAGLAECYCSGYGVTKNYSKALKLYQQAADVGNDKGLNGLGFMYGYGLSVEKDEEKAFRLCQQAANAGNGQAMRNVGISYTYGIGVEQDYAKAMSWYKKAVAADTPTAICNIGYMYENGWGVEQDAKTAFERYIEASKAGSRIASFYIAVCYREGMGVNQDYSLALEWYGKGIDDGLDICMYAIGYHYETGTCGLAQNYKLAMKWYKKAADLDYPDAMKAIGRMYEYGVGVEKNPSLAQEWYAKAKEADYAGTLSW